MTRKPTKNKNWITEIRKPTKKNVRAWQEALAQEIKDHEKTFRKMNRLIAIFKKLCGNPDSLSYPQLDVYGSNSIEDATAPLWTEAGLYGRVGKEAARTMLHYHRLAIALLDQLRKKNGK